jgi:DNA polymerase-3 subunit delta
MSAEKIIGDWKKANFKPIYWLEGEEPYFIDKIVEYAEHKILNESEASFNLTVFYGRDANWADVINACRRYPMFAERQVVLLKEAQHMKEIERLEGYVDNPLNSTVFVVSYKDKKVDARTKFAKVLKAKGEVFTTKKLYDNELPNWANVMISQHGLGISQKALLLLVDHVGNDLSRLENEIEKLAVNLGARKSINEDDIENYIGISKEFNVFELQAAFGKKDFAKAIRIVNYFEKNPKAGPIQLILPSLYSFFSKVYAIFSVGTTDEKIIASTIGISPFFVKDYIAASRNYNYQGVEKILLLLHHYNLRSLGIYDAGSSDAGLMKEFTVKVMTNG